MKFPLNARVHYHIVRYIYFFQRYRLQSFNIMQIQAILGLKMSSAQNYERDEYDEYNYEQDKLTGHGGKGKLLSSLIYCVTCVYTM